MKNNCNRLFSSPQSLRVTGEIYDRESHPTKAISTIKYSSDHLGIGPLDD
jgi:hypothetical protein